LTPAPASDDRKTPVVEPQRASWSASLYAPLAATRRRAALCLLRLRGSIGSDTGPGGLSSLLDGPGPCVRGDAGAPPRAPGRIGRSLHPAGAALSVASETRTAAGVVRSDGTDAACRVSPVALPPGLYRPRPLAPVGHLHAGIHAKRGDRSRSVEGHGDSDPPGLATQMAAQDRIQAAEPGKPKNSCRPCFSSSAGFERGIRAPRGRLDDDRQHTRRLFGLLFQSRCIRDPRSGVGQSNFVFLT
jgi:hypothetical protein